MRKTEWVGIGGGTQGGKVGGVGESDENSATDINIKSDQSVTAGEILLLLPWCPVLWPSGSI